MAKKSDAIKKIQVPLNDLPAELQRQISSIALCAMDDVLQLLEKYTGLTGEQFLDDLNTAAAGYLLASII